MAKKIKKKPEKNQSNNQGKIILIVAGVFLAVVAIFLIVMAIVQNAGKKNETDTTETQTCFTASQTDTSVDSATESDTASTVSTADTSEADKPDTSYMASVVIDETKDYFADIKIKDYGTIIVKLDYKAAPITARNFIYLAQSGFYKNLTFHRIMEGFMMQGGDPLGNGTGGSEHNIYGEFSANGYENPLSHTRGVISMARNSYDMNSASSQFFIVQSDNATGSLDGGYASFGIVTEGIEIVDAICHDAKPTDNNGTIPQDQQPVIESITIRTTDAEPALP